MFDPRSIGFVAIDMLSKAGSSRTSTFGITKSLGWMFDCVAIFYVGKLQYEIMKLLIKLRNACQLISITKQNIPLANENSNIIPTPIQWI